MSILTNDCDFLLQLGSQHPTRFITQTAAASETPFDSSYRVKNISKTFDFCNQKKKFEGEKRRSKTCFYKYHVLYLDIFMYLFLIQLRVKKNGTEENFFIFFNFILAFFLGKCLGFVHMHARRRRLWRLVSVLRLLAMPLPCLCRRAGQLKASRARQKKKKKKEMATFSHLKEWKKDDLILFQFPN